MKKASLALGMILGLLLVSTITAGISYAMSSADEALIRMIDGRRYSWDFHQPQVGGVDRRYIDVRGALFVTGIFSYGRRDGFNGDYPGKRIEIRGRETWYQLPSRDDFPGLNGYAVYVISEDGERITVTYHYQNGGTDEQVFLWQR